MNSNQSPAESTRLGNMVFTSAGVSLDVEGQPVWIKKDNDTASVAALQTLYRIALGDYQARQRPPAKPGWIQRLGHWLGRIFGGPRPVGREPRRDLRGVADTAAPADAPEPRRERQSPAPRPEPTVRSPEPAIQGPTEARQASEGGLFLRAVFADQGGVHLIWHRADTGKQPEETETICALDSRVADSLQDCYGHLARLGYKVIGLDLRPIGSPVTGKDGAHPTRNAAMPEPAVGKKSEAKERTMVVRLNPEVPEQPNRALVSPVDSAENTQILVAPERLIRSLRAAADLSHPPEDRLTYLRCATGKGGLKVVDVGLGEGKDNSPGRWADVSEWLAEQPEKGPGPKKPQPEPVTTQASNPELNLSL
jgi:hypothetical protein